MTFQSHFWKVQNLRFSVPRDPKTNFLRSEALVRQCENQFFPNVSESIQIAPNQFIWLISSIIPPAQRCKCDVCVGGGHTTPLRWWSSLQKKDKTRAAGRSSSVCLADGLAAAGTTRTATDFLSFALPRRSSCKGQPPTQREIEVLPTQSQHLAPGKEILRLGQAFWGLH